MSFGDCQIVLVVMSLLALCLIFVKGFRLIRIKGRMHSFVRGHHTMLVHCGGMSRLRSKEGDGVRSDCQHVGVSLVPKVSKLMCLAKVSGSLVRNLQRRVVIWNLGLLPCLFIVEQLWVLKLNLVLLETWFEDTYSIWVWVGFQGALRWKLVLSRILITAHFE